ncbi:hypothetical protein [Actinoplanes rectilineatus]|uniref:hypothetical protein n=1 Tax=Actinoplanes rectilineatus TaxID=113571 RepID=UPI0005F2C1E0|nr:hypothetical protein [Actinoplanes rectilineatus]
MTATLTARDILLDVHDAALLGKASGLAVASIAAMTGLPDDVVEQVLDDANRLGMVYLNRATGRWVAYDVCLTCGDDRNAHPDTGLCTVPAGARLPGFPL